MSDWPDVTDLLGELSDSDSDNEEQADEKKVSESSDDFADGGESSQVRTSSIYDIIL